MSLLTNFTIGSDPEFAIKVIGENRLIPSTDLFEGTKDFPTDIGNGYQILKDNVLVEGNIPPVTTREGFIHNMKYLKNYLNNFLNEKGLELHCTDVGDYEPVFLEDPEANMFGCEPFLNVWDGLSHTAPAIREPWRPLGKHIHIGYDSDELPKTILNQYIVKALDVLLLLPAYQLHTDARRMGNYGGPGQYRKKPYGLEYRSLGGHFLQDKYLGWTYDRVMDALNFVADPSNLAVLEQFKSINLDDIASNYEALGINTNYINQVTQKELIKA